MRSYTINNVMDLDLCEEHLRTRVAELWDGRDRLTASEIAGLDIPVEDRIWALTGLAAPRTARLFACDCAERALQQVVDAGGSTDPRSWGAIDIARQYADGDRTDEDLRAAEAAARSAARSADAAWAAARSAAWVAAWAAARSAADAAADAADAAIWAATWAAAEDAADCADESIAWSATERAWQIHHLVEMMEADND